MNKKILSAVLFGALLAFSTGTFTSCKDYDDDINGLQEQIDKNGSTISALQSQLTALETAATAAKATADAAKTAAEAAKAAAEAAQATGDAAKADAAAAKAKAEEAIAAAAQAKADAIAEAKKEVAALKTLMESALAAKVDQNVFDAALEVVNAKIEGIQTGLSTLQGTVAAIDGRVVENAKDIKDAQTAITNLIAADVDLQTQLNALKLYAEATNADVKEAQADIVAAQAEIKKLWDQLTEDKASLQGLIGGNTSAIELLSQDLEATSKDVADLRDDIQDQLDAVKREIAKIQADIVEINNQIIAINGNLASLHTLIVCRLTSMVFAADYFVPEVGDAIVFNSLVYGAMSADENAGIPTTYKFSTASLATASYHFNPASFKLTNADYHYIDRSKEVVYPDYIMTRAAASKWVAIEGSPTVNATEGTVDFKLRRLNAHSTQPECSKINTVALQAVLKGDAIDAGESGVVVTSDYAAIADKVLNEYNVLIADKATLKEGDDAHFPTTFDKAKNGKVWYTDMSYDKIFNLKEKIATCINSYDYCHDIDEHREFNLADYNLEYKFYVASSAYDIAEGNTSTNQQKWIECTDAKEGLFKAQNFSKEAIGRTPIMKIEIVDQAGNVVRRAFVKVQIGVTKQADLTVGITNNLTFNCATTPASYTITEDYIRENVYRVITNGREVSMSHEEFWNIYDVTTAIYEVKKNNKLHNMSKPAIVDGASGVGTATKKVVWNFKQGEIGTVGAGGAQLVASATVKNKLVSSEYPANVTFKFTVNVSLPQFTLAKTENAIYWSKDAAGKFTTFNVNVAVPDSETSPASDCQFSTPLTDAYTTTYKVTGLPTCTDDYYEIVKTFSNGVATVTPMSGVFVDGLNIKLDKNNTTVKAALNSTNGLQATVAHVYKLESGDKVVVNEFMVNFIRPVNLNMPAGVTVADAKDGGDVADFQWNGLLTDWRGKAIVAPTMENVTGSYSYWHKICVTEYDYVPGYYKETKPASLKVTTDKVSFTAGSAVTMYSGSATYKIERQRYSGGSSWEFYRDVTFTTAEPKLTKDMVDADIEAQLQEYINSLTGTYRSTIKGDITYAQSSVGEGQLVEYTYVKSVEYVPAELTWVEPTHTPKRHDHTSMPTYKGTTNGQTSGCWEWIELTYSWSDLTTGQYWNYYGAFGDVTADVTKATTNVSYNGGKLPSDVTLVQINNTVKYDNIGSPINDTYQIYIPVTVTYGWGKLASTLTITVNPVK